MAPPVRTTIEKPRDTDAQLTAVRTFIAEEPEVVSIDRFEVTARERNMSVSKIEPDKVSVLEAEFASEVAADVSERYLVWKDTNGDLGFGNMTYPDADKLAVTRQGKWYHVEREAAKGRQPIPSAMEPEITRKSMDMIAADFSEKYLVWKDRNGAIGFGNVEFPEADRLSISADNSWYNLERRRESGEKPDRAIAGVKEETMSVAARWRGQYLMWKDDRGMLGFSNVAFPHQESLTVSTDRGWDLVNMRPSKAEELAASEVPPRVKKGVDSAVSEMSDRYLVWRDKDGTVGFGNIQYPKVQNISHVHDGQNWKEILNSRL